jgi:hypothetical protein
MLHVIVWEVPLLTYRLCEVTGFFFVWVGSSTGDTVGP